MALEAGEVATDVNTFLLLTSAFGETKTAVADDSELFAQSYSLLLVTNLENAALDSKIGFNYTLNRDKIYIGLKPLVEIDRKPLTGLVYPYITTFKETERVVFNPNSTSGVE